MNGSCCATSKFKFTLAPFSFLSSLCDKVAGRCFSSAGGSAPEAASVGLSLPSAVVRGFVVTKCSDLARTPFREGWGGTRVKSSFQALAPLLILFG